jgi:hypothetical protein
LPPLHSQSQAQPKPAEEVVVGTVVGDMAVAGEASAVVEEVVLEVTEGTTGAVMGDITAADIMEVATMTAHIMRVTHILATVIRMDPPSDLADTVGVGAVGMGMGGMGMGGVDSEDA